MEVQKSQYKDLNDWEFHKPEEYKIAKRRNLLHTICKIYEFPENQIYKQRKNGFWTREKVLERSVKYTRTSDWVKFDKASLMAAQKLGIFEEASKHMKRLKIQPTKRKTRGYWTEKKVLQDSAKYERVIDWKKHTKGSLSAAKRLGIYKKATAHMKKVS